MYTVRTPSFTSVLVVLIAALAAVLVPAHAARGQGCPAGWLPGEGVPGVFGGVYALAALPDGDVIVGGPITTAGGVPANNIARYNPSTNAWSALGSGTDGFVYALAVLPGGDVVVGGQFTTAGGVPANNIARYNPSTNAWSSLGSGTSGPVYALSMLPDGELIVGGSFSNAGPVLANSVARFKPRTAGGGTWSALGSGTNGDVNTLAVLPGGDVIAGGEFTTAGGVPANRIARYNFSTNSWSALGSGTSGSVYALAILPGGDVMVGGGFTTAGGVPANRIARYNPSTAGGGTWSAPGSGMPGAGNYVSALAVLPEGDVIVGGVFLDAGGEPANRIARYNPATNAWSAIGSGTNGGVRALAVLPGGNVMVGGGFSIAGGVPVSNIARYNPSANTWSALGSGTNGPISAVFVLPGGDVMVGGSFFTAGGVPANSIARYHSTTSTWSALGTGVGGSFRTVYALALLPGGDVIAGGTFTTVGSVTTNRVARYNASTNTWSPLGSGTNREVRALAVLPGGDVMVGGSFSTAGGVPANNIARYNPSTNAWSAVGTGTNSGIGVYALVVLPGGDVILGGFFSAAGGVPASNIARYNPSADTWSALGSGISANGTVYALSVLPDGDVLVGGVFATAGGVPLGSSFNGNIARYNPHTNSWSALGLGTNRLVYALAALPNGDVIVGGDFTTAGGVPANNIARYSPSTAGGGTWSALGSGMNGYVTALAVLPGGDVMAGGGFLRAGGNVSAYFARYTFGSTCAADFNCQGGVTVQDIFDYLTAYFAASLAADFNADTTLSVQDIFDFLTAWFAGC